MKKTLLIIGLIIFTFTTVNAQNGVDFGVKGGINFSNMISDYFAENDSKTGIHFGLIAEIPFGDKFSIQPEILYSSQGTKAKIFMNGGSPRPSEYNLDYIQIPILAKFYLVQNLSLEVGPSFNFLLKDEEIYNSVTITDVGNNIEFGGVLGVSYKVKGGLFASFRYVNGFSVALDRKYTDEDAKNRVVQLGIGFMF
ncbi:MAG: porin family protein [Lutibacter sp.]